MGPDRILLISSTDFALLSRKFSVSPGFAPTKKIFNPPPLKTFKMAALVSAVAVGNHGVGGCGFLAESDL